jgi:hypothetical protein
VDNRGDLRDDEEVEDADDMLFASTGSLVPRSFGGGGPRCRPSSGLRKRSVSSTILHSNREKSFESSKSVIVPADQEFFCSFLEC